MSKSRSGTRFLVQDHVRPALEILEPDSTGPGFQLAAIVYGDKKEIAEARAQIVAVALDLEGSKAHLKKRMRWAAIYTWAIRMYRQKRQPQALYELVVWLLGCVLDTENVLQWLEKEHANEYK
jgi:hypothetical protein